MAHGTRQCRQESSLKRRGYRPCSPPGQGIVRGRRSGTKVPIHLTDTCPSSLSSWTGYCLGGGGLAQQCPSISLTLARPRSPPGQGIVRGGRSGTKMPIHLTDTCRWCLYDSFDAHSQLKINDTYRRYQCLMHRLSILRSYQSASSGATRSVTNTMLVWDTGASIGLTPFLLMLY